MLTVHPYVRNDGGNPCLFYISVASCSGAQMGQDGYVLWYTVLTVAVYSFPCCFWSLIIGSIYGLNVYIP